MVYYLDTSALLKRYVQEVGSSWIATLYESPHQHTLISAQITKVDAIQLAAAVTVQNILSRSDLATLTFLSADTILLQAAEHESLLIDNPNSHA